MGDVYDTQTRRRVMQSIRKTDTRPEIRVRRVLHRLGYRFRLHRRDLPGIPDIVLPKHKIVIFVHGCFWHQHTCPLGKLPKSNRKYWVPKLRANAERDATHAAELRQLNWKVIAFWECEVQTEQSIERLIRRKLRRWARPRAARR
ncbi:MAG: DNA mismatch endonuclease Vsr [Planctomycetota bacterium]